MPLASLAGRAGAMRPSRFSPVSFVRRTPPPTGLPTWNSGAVNEIISITGTTHSGSAADPGSTNQARLVYSGAGLTDAGVFVLAACGGHNDYDGNEVTSIDLSANSPAWVLNKAKSTSRQDQAYYADGTPTSRHTNWCTQWNSIANRMMLHYTRTAYGGVESFGDTNGFNLSNNTWDADNTWADAPGLVGCRNPSNDQVFGVASDRHSMNRWTPGTDSWETGIASNGGATYGFPWAFDTNRGKLFCCAFGNGEGDTGLQAWRLDSDGANGATAITFNSSAGYTQFLADGDGYAGMVYSSHTDRFYWYACVSGRTTRIYEITPNAGTTWDIAIVSVTGATPAARAGSDTLCNRFQYLQAQKTLVWMATCDNPLYAMRVA